MLNNIPSKIKDRMSYLESLDLNIRSNKANETPLYQISQDSGIFLSIVASLAPEGRFIEIGTSGGYSGLWLSLACMKRNGKFTTFEINPSKYQLALETFKIADVLEYVEPINGDAEQYIKNLGSVAFCYLDGGDYCKFYDLMVPQMIPGSILVADNMIIPKNSHDDFVQKALNDSSMDAVVVPIGTGMLLSKKI